MKKMIVLTVIVLIGAVFFTACATGGRGAGGLQEPVEIRLESFRAFLENPDNSFLNSEIAGIKTEDGRQGVAQMADGIEAYYIEHAAVNRGTTVNTSPVKMARMQFPQVNVRGATYVTIDIAADNMEVLNNIIGFYPRIIGHGNGGSGAVKFNHIEQFEHAKAQLQADPMVFVTLEMPIQGQFPGEIFGISNFNDAGRERYGIPGPVNSNQVLSHAAVVTLEFVIRADVPGRMYFRNLRFQ